MGRDAPPRETLAAAIGAAAEAVSYADLGEDALPAAVRAVGASNALIYRYDEAGVVRGVAGTLAPAIPSYVKELFEQDPVQHHLIRLGMHPPVVLTIHDMDRRAYLRSAAYNEFYRPHDMEHLLGMWLTDLPYGTPGMAGILFTRAPGEPDFAERDGQVLAQVVPAFQAAARRARKVEQAHGERVALGAVVSAVAPGAHVGQGPPEVQVFSRRDGSLLQRVPLQNVDLTQEHGMSAGAFDLFNRLYVLSVEQGVVRIDFNTGRQDLYATALPFLPMCSAVPAGTPCAPKLAPLPPLGNDIVFDWEGNAYITDSFQATIFRVPPGGGAPQIWFQDPRLAGPPGGFGTNGMRMGLDGHFYVNVTQEAATGDGVVYRLAHVDHPTAADLVQFHRWSGGTGNPDDMAFGASGRLYVSQPFTNDISILAPDGTEITRFPSSAQAASLPVPFDMPSGIAFDDLTRSVYITNHAEFSGITANMVVFKSYVNDIGWPLARPLIF